MRKKSKGKAPGKIIKWFATTVPTTIAAVVLVPMAYAQRGYLAIGGEWLLILAIFCITCYVVCRQTDSRFTTAREQAVQRIRKGGEHRI